MGCGNYSPDFYELVESQRLSTDFKEWLEDFFNSDDANNIIVAIENGDWNAAWESPEVVSKKGNVFDRQLGDGTVLIKKESEKSLLSFYSARGMGTEQGSTAVRNVRRKFRREIVNRLIYDFEDKIGIRANVMTPTGNKGSKLLYQFKIELLQKIWTVTGKDYSEDLKENEITFTNIVSQTIQDYQTKLRSGDDASKNADVYDAYVMLIQFDNLLSSEIDFIKIKDAYRKGTVIGIDMYDYVGSTMKRDTAYGQETAATSDYTGSIVKLLLDEMFPMHQENGDIIIGEYLTEESFNRAMAWLKNWLRYSNDVDSTLKSNFLNNFSEFDIADAIDAYIKYDKQTPTRNDRIIRDTLYTIRKYIFTKGSGFPQEIMGSFKRHVKDNYSETYEEYGFDLAAGGIVPSETTDYLVRRQERNVSKIIRSQVNMWIRKPNIHKNICETNNITIGTEKINNVDVDVIKFNDGLNEVIYKLTSSVKNGIVSYSVELVGSKNSINELSLDYCIKLLRQVLGLELPIGYEAGIKDILKVADNSVSENDFIMALFGEAMAISIAAGATTDKGVRKFNFKINNKTKLLDTYLYNKYLKPIAKFFTLEYGQDSVNVIKNQEGNSLPLYTVGSLSKKIREVIHVARKSNIKENPFIRVASAIKSDSIRGQVNWGGVIKSSKDLRMSELFATLPILDYFYNLESENGIVKLVPITTSDKSKHPLYGVDLSEFVLGNTTAQDILKRIAKGGVSTTSDLQLLQDELIRYRGGHAKAQLTNIVNMYLEIFGLSTTNNLDRDIVNVNKELAKHKKISEIRQMFIDAGYDFNETLYIDSDFNGNLSLNQELLEEHLIFNTQKDQVGNYLMKQRRMFAEDMHQVRFLINLNVFKHPEIEKLAKKLGSDWVDDVSKEMKPFIIKINGKVVDVSWAENIPEDAEIELNPIFESYFWASTIYGNALGDLLAGHISSYKKATRFYKENKNQVIVPLNELSKILNITDGSGNIVQLVASSSYDEIQSLRSVIVTSLQTEQSVLGNLESVKGALLAKGLNPKILDTIKTTSDGNIYFQFDDQLKLEGGIPVYDISDERAFRTVTKAERVKDKTKRALFIGSTVTSPLWGDSGVPPKEVNIACITDLPGFAFNLMGQQHNKESQDGCGFVTSSFARGTNKGMYDAAVGNAVRKTIAGGLYEDTGSFWEIKWAEMVVNNIMRAQTYDESEFSMEVMFKMMHDKKFLLKDKQTLNLSEFYDAETKKARYDNHGELKTHLDYVYFFNPEDGNYYKIIRITEDENSPGDVERTIVQVAKQGDTWIEVGEHIKKTITINSLYDIDQLFGGCFCKKMTADNQLVDSDANEEILYKVISNKNLWDYMISIVVNQSGMKVGQKNVNETMINDGQNPNQLNAYGDNKRTTIFSKGFAKKLNSFKLSMDFYGAIMDADHELQNATVREANQLISALMQDDNNYEIVSRIYHDIGEVAYKSLKPFFDVLEFYKQGDPTKLFEKIGKAVIDAYDMRNQEDIGLAYAFLDNIDENVGHIPFSVGSISSVALSSLGSTLTKLAIKTDYPGSGSVQVPSNGFMKTYTYKGRIYNYEGLVREIVKTNAMAGTNINVREIFETPGDLRQPNPFVVKLFDEKNGDSGRLKIDFEDTIIEEDVKTGVYKIIKISTPETRDYYRHRKNDPNVRYYRWETRSRDLLPPSMTYVVNGQTFNAYDLDPVRVQTYIRMLNGKHTLPDSDRIYMETFIKDYAISNGMIVLNSPEDEIILTADVLKSISKKAERHLKRLLSTFSKIQKGQTNFIENQSAFGLIGQVVEVSDLHVESGQIIAGKAFMDLFDLVDSDQMSDILRLKHVFFRERLQNKYSLPKNSVVNGDFYDSVIYTRSGEKILVVQSSKDEYGNWNDPRLNDVNDYIGLDFEVAKNKVWYKSERGDEEICSSDHLMIKSLHTDEGTFTVLIVDNLNVIDDISATGVASHIRYNINEHNYTYVASRIDEEFSIEGDPTEIVRILWNTELARNIKAIDNLAEERWIAFQKSINYVGTRIPAQSMQSFMPLKVVAFTSSVKNEVYVPFSLTWAAGSDYDIDKLYLMGYSIRKDGTLYTNTHLGSEYNISQRLKLPRGMGREFVVGENGNIVTEADLIAFSEGKDLTKFNDCLRSGSTIISFIGKATKENTKRLINFVKQLNRHERYRMTPSQEDGALKNSVVERIIDVLHDPKNMINMLKPVSADSLKKVAEKSPIGKRELSLNLDTPSVIILMQYQNMLGKTGIASSATGLKAYFGELTYYAKKVRQIENILRTARDLDPLNRKIALKKILDILEECAFNSPLTNELRLISNINPEEMLDIIDSVEGDLDFWKINKPDSLLLNYGDAIKGNIIDIAEVIRMISENSNRNDCPSNDSEVLTASTDNAKDPILGKVNALPATIDIWTYLFSVGESIDDVADFMSSKVMRTICAFIDTNIFGSDERFNMLDSCVKFVNDESPLYIQDYLWNDLVILNDTDDSKSKKWNGIIPKVDSLLDYLLYSDRNPDNKAKERTVRPGIEKMLRHFGISWNGRITPEILESLHNLIHGEYKNGKFFTKVMSTYYGTDYNPRKLLLEYLRLKVYEDIPGYSGLSEQDMAEIEQAKIEAELAAAQAMLDNPEIGTYIAEDEQLPNPVKLYKYIKNFFIPKCEMLMERLDNETFDWEYFSKIDANWEINVAQKIKLLTEKILPGVKEQQLVGKSLSNNKGLATVDFEEYNWIAQYEKRVNQIYISNPSNSDEVFVFEKFMSDPAYRSRQIIQMQKYRTTFNVLDVFTSVEHFWKRAHAISLLRNLVETIGVFKLERKFEREVLRKEIPTRIVNGEERLINATKNHTYVLSNLGWTKLRHFTKEVILQNWFMLQQGLTFNIPTGENYWSHNTATKTTEATAPMELNLSTYHGQKSFKLLMESYIIPRMKIDPNFANEPFVQRLIPSEDTDFSTGEVTTYYKYPFPLRKGRATSKYNSLYDEVLISFNNLAQKQLSDYGIGDWKIGELFFIYNLIVHKDSSDADSFNELFTDLTIANNPLKMIKSYYDFMSSVDANVDKLVYNIDDLRLMLVGTSDEYHVFNRDAGERVERKGNVVTAYTATGEHEFGNKSEDDTGNLYFLTQHNNRPGPYKRLVEDSEAFKDSRIKTYSPKLDDLSTKRAIVRNIIKTFNYKSGVSVELLNTFEIKEKFKYIAETDRNLYNRIVSEKAFIHEGVVYINEDTMSIESPVHEFMHLVCAAMKFGPNSQRYYALLRKIADDPEIAEHFGKEINSVSEDRRNLTDYREEILVKVLAGYFGKRFTEEWWAKVGDKLTSIRAEEYVSEIVKTIFGTSAVPNNYGSSLSSYLEEFGSALFDLSDSWRVSILQSQKLKAIREKLIKTDNLNYTGDC